MTLLSPQMQLAAAASAKARYRRQRVYGLMNWSSTNRMQQSSTAIMQGDGTGFEFVRTLFVYWGGGTGQRLLEHRENNDGYWIFIDGASRFHFRVYNGSTFAQVTSAALTVGRVYAVYAGYNGSNLFLTVNGVHYSATGSGFSPSTDVAALGCASTANGADSPANTERIIGVGASDSTPVLGATGRANYCSACMARNDIVSFSGAEHLYSEKRGSLAKDLIGSADWSVVGTGLARTSWEPTYG